MVKDFVGIFISHKLKKRRKHTRKTQRATVYGEYLYHCNLMNEKPVSNYRFYKELEARGFRKSVDGKYLLNAEAIKCQC